MYMCVYIYLVCNSETVHRNTPVPKYSIPIVNSEWFLEQNSKPCYQESDLIL